MESNHLQVVLQTQKFLLNWQLEINLGGWDRTASGDWHSILRLNAEQSKAANNLLEEGLKKIQSGLAIPKSVWAMLETESFVTELRWKFLILKPKTWE